MHGSKLYVGNLDYSVTNQGLKELFSNYGEVVDIKIIGNKGIAFVEMSKQVEAETARKELNGTDFRGRDIRIDAAQPIKKKRNFRR